MLNEAYCPTCMRVVFPDGNGRCRTCKKPTQKLPKGWPSRTPEAERERPAR